MAKLSSYSSVTTPLITDTVPITSGGATHNVLLSNLPKGVTKTVATAASGFVADYICTGTADDVQLQLAFNASVGGVCYVKAGNYDITATVTFPSNTSFIFDRNAIFKANASMVGNTNMFQNSDTVGGNSAIYITGGQFNGNQANRSSKVTGQDEGGANLMFKNCSNVVIEKIESYNGASTSCITFAQGTVDSIIKDSLFHDSWNHNILIVGARTPAVYCQRNTIKNNVIYGAGNGGSQGVGIEVANLAILNTFAANRSYNNLEGGLHLYWLSNKNKVINNVFYGNKYGVAIVNQSDYNIVSNNTIDNITQSGILITIDGAGGLTYGGKYLTVTGNTITNCGWNGIRANVANDLSYSSIEANIIDTVGTIQTGKAASGMYFNTTQYAKVIGNNITNSVSNGIYFDIATHMKAIGNDCHLNGGIGLIESGAANFNIITGNDLTNNTGVALTTVGASDVIANNITT